MDVTTAAFMRVMVMIGWRVEFITRNGAISDSGLADMLDCVLRMARFGNRRSQINGSQQNSQTQAQARYGECEQHDSAVCRIPLLSQDYERGKSISTIFSLRVFDVICGRSE